MAVCCIHIDKRAGDLDDDALGNLAAVFLFDSFNHLGCRLGRRLLDIVGDKHFNFAALGAGIERENRDSLFIQTFNAGNQGDEVFRACHDEGIDILGDEVVDRVQDLVGIGLRVHDLQLISVFFTGVCSTDDKSLDELGLSVLDDHTDGLCAALCISGIHCSCRSRCAGCLGIGSISLCLLSLAGRALHGTAAACQQHGTHGHCEDSSQNFFHYLSFHNNVSSRKSVRLLWAAVDGLQ